jgi:preprotein translocase SecE subunit
MGMGGCETGAVEPLPAGARTPPRPPRPPAPSTTRWAGQPSWGQARPVVIERTSALDFFRETISEMRRVVWPSRPTTIFNARTVLAVLFAVGVGIASVSLATGDALGSLIH